MILGLFKFIIIAILVVILLGIIFIFGVFRSLSNIRKQFTNMGNNMNVHMHRRKGDTDEEIVIDNRPRNEANRKIFSDDEGEYVEFEEEK